MKLISGKGPLKKEPSGSDRLFTPLSRLELTAVTPIHLEEEEEDLLKQELTRLLGIRPRIKFETSPRLLAGMILRTKDRDIDGSIGRQLRRIRRILLEHDLKVDERTEISTELLLAEIKKVVQDYQPELIVDDVGTVQQYGDGVADITGLYG